MGDGIRFVSAGPLSILAVIVLIGLVILVVPLLIIGVIGKAFTTLGFSWITALALVLLMLIGSMVNIPLYRIKRDMIRINQNPMVFNSGEDSESAQVWETIITINLGGAILPLAIAGYLVNRAIPISGPSLVLPIVAGTIIVASVAFSATRVIPGAGMHVPLLMPGLTALLAAILLSGGAGTIAAVAAFTSGVAGTLLGGNIAWLPKIRDSEAALFSIGGSGTFASVFICCIVPALIT